ncbi:hypothetical protein [Kitasatospora sp. NPDC058478]|uniref:hypothetical protein n=1 Tax=unclassified Kitasatospora TaxID=2633591 RepID=UPI0036697A24
MTEDRNRASDAVEMRRTGRRPSSGAAEDRNGGTGLRGRGVLAWRSPFGTTEDRNAVSTAPADAAGLVAVVLRATRIATICPAR